MAKLFAGEVDEGQVVEAGGDGGVVLDEGAPVGVLGEELVDPRIVTQQPAVGSERQAAEVTPTKTAGVQTGYELASTMLTPDGRLANKYQFRPLGGAVSSRKV